MIRSKLNFILMLLAFFPMLNAYEAKQSSLYYIKLGAVYPPGEPVLPTVGVGARFQRNRYGFDLSANIGSLIFANYASLKGLALFYPFPENKNQLYFGIGPGIGYSFGSVPMGQPQGSASWQHGFLNAEAVVGYEFRHTPRLKTFVQLELSQPVSRFGKSKRHSRCTPGCALTAGIGF